MPASCCLVLLRSVGDSWLFRSMLMLGKARVAGSSPRSSPCPAAAHAPSCLSSSATVVSYSATLCMPASCSFFDVWVIFVFPSTCSYSERQKVVCSSSCSSPCPAAAPPPPCRSPSAKCGLLLSHTLHACFLLLLRSLGYSWPFLNMLASGLSCLLP